MKKLPGTIRLSLRALFTPEQEAFLLSRVEGIVSLESVLEVCLQQGIEARMGRAKKIEPMTRDEQVAEAFERR